MIEPQLKPKQDMTISDNHPAAEIRDEQNRIVIETATQQNVEQRTDHKPHDQQEEDDDRDHIDVEAKLLNNTTHFAVTKPTINDKCNEKSEQDRTMTEDINNLLRDMPLTEDVTCGFWFLKGTFFQRFANQTAYVVLYGLVGCVYAMTYAYFNGTLTTIEKRFKIPSKNSAFITVGNDISQIMVSTVLTYYGGKSHRPRWMGFGLLTIVTFCILTATPHFLYGPGADALSLTAEFGAMPNENATMEEFDEQHSTTLCRPKGAGAECQVSEGSLAPLVVLFIAQFIQGIGGSLYFTLGITYMDDNIKKSKTPALLSLHSVLMLMGPTIGYALASFCLRVYIAPQLHPIINNNDPRWVGAWWMGWLIMAGMIFVSAVILSMFPKELPRAKARRLVEEERRKQRESTKKILEKERLTETLDDKSTVAVVEPKASFKDMLKTFKRLITNKIWMCYNISCVFYLYGFTPYSIFTAKYIEVQFRQSAATSSMVTGTVASGFIVVGVLLSGFVMSKYKPCARHVVAWNVIIGFLTVGAMVAYAFIGCPENEKSVIVNIHDSNALAATPTCNSDCNCDYVPYTPVCGENSLTYISPCHAGCKRMHNSPQGKEIFYDCSCIPGGNYTTDASPVFERLTSSDLTAADFIESERNNSHLESNLATTLSTSITAAYPDVLLRGQAIPGACPVNCFKQLVIFLAVTCCLKFIGATGGTAEFLLSIRCVPEKDKAAALGFSMMFLSTILIPSPILFGWVIDRLCLVWGKTCTEQGNCWLYDPESLRYILNFGAAIFFIIGVLIEVGLWFYVKDLKIFDEEAKEDEMEIVQHEVEVNFEKKREIKF